MKSKGLVCVVGAGYLGTQIGVQCARYDFTVNMYDVSREALNSSSEAVNGYIQNWIDEAEFTVNEGKGIKEKISFLEDLTEAAASAGIVIEAVVENLKVKREVFKQLDEICGEETILATNSSSIRVSKIEDATSHPERVFNMHFYSNPWRSRIVELMKGTATSDETMEKARTFSINIGMNPLMVLKESTGFIFNRVWRAIKKECLKVANEGIASFEDVDRAWMSLYGTSVGPFGLMDRVGLDVVKDIEMVYYEESRDPSDAPPKVLFEKIERGDLGVKTGQGFYSYPNPSYMDPGWLHGDSSIDAQ
ncbi:MAG: 3-hydroxyacyl-CoA dehydrogenase family protein [Candidatus Bathyarchaeota archaeon]|nr:3-hydroxyacyl-CoA dehydrogenase family protein [Candidatus Bathyarchaeota archaeon]